MLIKKLKTSKRGLTFTTSAMEVGMHYRYFIDKYNNIIIVPDETGNMTVSKKARKNGVAPLIDIRSKEIRELVATSDFMEVVLQDDKSILVKIVKLHKAKSKIIRLQDILDGEGEEFSIPLEMVADGPCIPCNSQSYKKISASHQFFTSQDGKEQLNTVYRVMSLFSGAGMLDYAFHNDKRFNIVYANDFEKSACETYKFNIGDISNKDIRTVEPDEIPDCDVAIGGTCCQAYSSENRHNINSEAGEQKRLLIDDFARLVKAKNVKVWVAENVPEILTRDQGYYLERLCNSLPDYKVTYKVLADDELGGYSVRKRAIIIGSKIGNITFPNIKVLHKKTVKEALDKVDSSWFNFEDISKSSEKTIKRMSFIPQGGNWKDIPEQLRGNMGSKTHSCLYKRLKLDEPSITLCNFRKSLITHPTENRIISVAEASAIMGLDKKFRFIGTLAEKQQMVANGVTQAIGNFVKNIVGKALDNFYKNNLNPCT